MWQITSIPTIRVKIELDDTCAWYNIRMENLNLDYERIVLVKKWGHRLKSKASADQLRKVCISKLDPNSPLVINLAGVRAISPGFANEAFGLLLIEARKRGAKVSFSCPSEEVGPNLLVGIRDALSHHKGS